METLNFTQFAVKNGFPSDYDILDHGMLSPSGKHSKRAHKFAMDQMLKRMDANKEAHRLFREKILAGDVLDADGKITKESLEQEVIQDLQKQKDNAKQTLIYRKNTLESFCSRKINSPRMNATKKEYLALCQEIEAL